MSTDPDMVSRILGNAAHPDTSVKESSQNIIDTASRLVEDQRRLLEQMLETQRAQCASLSNVIEPVESNSSKADALLSSVKRSEQALQQRAEFLQRAAEEFIRKIEQRLGR